MWFTGIPIGPSVNHAYPSSRYGRRFKSKEMLLWQRQFDVWALKNNLLIVEGVKKFGKLDRKTPVDVQIRFFFKRARIFCKDGSIKKLDLDNRAKVIIDALTGELKFDDSKIFNLELIKEEGLDDHCNVRIREFV